ncbi:MAG: ribosomal RNA small subunit methyltransferase A [Solirubrobacterales bacterium]|nr:ribosomal RNA small subunit methyltransferase A [Solirubrobacterales bacterium]
MVSRRKTGPRSLGQNFLVDQNIIDVIARLAALNADDVVLEVGGGEGILTRRLVADTGFVHLIEVDRGLADGLSAALADRGVLHVADAASYDMGSLDPAPTKMVANLPYGVGATVVLKTVFETGIDEWVVMLQKEVGERFAASVGSPAYGVPSVLAQLVCDVKVLRQISRNVFRPVPNVDSVLLGLRRRTDFEFSPAEASRGSSREIRKLVQDSFAHRRKALAKSVSLVRGDNGVRDRLRESLVELGFPDDARAERLAPEDYVALVDRLAG